MKHIAKYNTSGDVQTALNEGALENPYVALVSGNLDYNTAAPAPATMGTWSDDGQGVYTFQVTETDGHYWGMDNPVKIGTLDGIYYQSEDPMNMDVLLFGNGESDDFWIVKLHNDDLSEDPAENMFMKGSQDTWNAEDILTEEQSSNASLAVSYDGLYTLVFQKNPEGSGPALQMTTINPPYPAGE